MIDPFTNPDGSPQWFTIGAVAFFIVVSIVLLLNGYQPID